MSEVFEAELDMGFGDKGGAGCGRCVSWWESGSGGAQKRLDDAKGFLRIIKGFSRIDGPM